MKKIIILVSFCFSCIFVYSQDSMNKKMDNKTDKMNKKVDNTMDPMNKKIQNGPDSAKRRAFPKRTDTLKRKTVPAPTKKKAIEK